MNWRRTAGLLILGVATMTVVLVAVGVDGRGSDNAAAHRPGVASQAQPPSSPLPWLRRDGRFLRAEDGRIFIVNGVDYAYNTVGLIDMPFDLTDADLDRIVSWGMNTLRIRLRDYRAGWVPGRPPNPGYLEGLDDLVRRANARGLYVILAMDGPDDMLRYSEKPAHPLFDQAKFLPGNPARAHWLSYLASIFTRYKDWSGVIGFDPVNEDISYPPDILDSVFMEAAHRDALATLRRLDARHVYFQQPGGWDYQGGDAAIGYDLGDPNRFFCTKWAPQNRPLPEGLAQQQRWAQDAGTPLFLCEYNLGANPANPNFNERAALGLQRQTISAIQESLTGAVRLGYLPAIAGTLVDADHQTEAFWVQELARPFPVWLGGAPTAVRWDFGRRVLQLDLERDGSGPTEVYVTAPRSYPDGFVASSSDGGRLVVVGDTIHQETGLRWDARSSRLILPSGQGPVTLTIAPLDAGRSVRLTAAGIPAASALQAGDGPPAGQEQVYPAAAFERTVGPIQPSAAAFEGALVASGSYTAPQARCIAAQLSQHLPPEQFVRLVTAQNIIDFRLAEAIGRSVWECVKEDYGLG